MKYIDFVLYVIGLILILNDKSLTVIKTICSLETKKDIEKEIVYCIEGHSYLKQEVH